MGSWDWKGWEGETGKDGDVGRIGAARWHKRGRGDRLESRRWVLQNEVW